MKHLLIVVVCLLIFTGFAAGQGSYNVVSQAQCTSYPVGSCTPSVNLLIYPTDTHVTAYRFTVVLSHGGVLDSVTVFADVRLLTPTQRLAWATIPTSQYGDVSVVSAFAQPLINGGETGKMTQQ